MMMKKRITSIFLTAVLSVALTFSSGMPGAVGLDGDIATAASANAGDAAYTFKPDKSAVAQLKALFTTIKENKKRLGMTKYAVIRVK